MSKQKPNIIAQINPIFFGSAIFQYISTIKVRGRYTDSSKKFETKTSKKNAKNIPTDTKIPKSFNSGNGETMFVKNPTIVAKVAKVNATPTDLSVDVVEPAIVFPDPISSLYLEVK